MGAVPIDMNAEVAYHRVEVDSTCWEGHVEEGVDDRRPRRPREAVGNCVVVVESVRKGVGNVTVEHPVMAAGPGTLVVADCRRSPVVQQKLGEVGLEGSTADRVAAGRVDQRLEEALAQARQLEVESLVVVVDSCNLVLEERQKTELSLHLPSYPLFQHR